MSFPTGGNQGWAELGTVTPAAPISRPLPVVGTAKWYDPAPLGGGALQPSSAIEIGASTVKVYSGASTEARFRQPEVFGAALLDSFGIGDVWLPFPFRFSWPMQHGYEFLTDILTAADGNEQRIAARNPDRPRRWVRALVQASHRDASYTMQALLHGWNAKTYGVPIWWDSMAVNAALLVGDTIVSVVDETYRDLIQGRLALLWVDHDQFEIVTIDSVAPGAITLVDPITRAWAPYATLLVPLRLGHLADVIDLTRVGVHIAEYSCEFLLDPDP